MIIPRRRRRKRRRRRRRRRKSDNKLSGQDYCLVKSNSIRELSYHT